ncbi:MAG: AzlD domain-containing protein [Treponema sp.]|jgi:branched-subunit amino acid transport protein AzlD|nr:AzlD domain-containing protein [Treponema sp.]
MKTGVNEALLLTLVMALVIYFCRVFPFLLFRGKDTGAETDGKSSGGRAAFLNFVEKTVPPLAMTVLAFNSLAGPIYENIREAVPVLAGAAFTALVHLWRRNPLISIFGGTALYMLLKRLF